MKKKNFSEAQIVLILRIEETGRNVKDICRGHGTSDATFYNWKEKYGDLTIKDKRHNFWCRKG